MALVAEGNNTDICIPCFPNPDQTLPFFSVPHDHWGKSMLLSYFFFKGDLQPLFDTCLLNLNLICKTYCLFWSLMNKNSEHSDVLITETLTFFTV